MDKEYFRKLTQHLQHFLPVQAFHHHHIYVKAAQRWIIIFFACPTLMWKIPFVMCVLAKLITPVIK